jgi:Ca2+-binding EF-hand superfamily protein
MNLIFLHTNRDGELSRKELRIALYSYGIDLSKIESEEIKNAADTDGSGLIAFDEYLEFIGPTGSRFKAVRNTLLGPT